MVIDDILAALADFLGREAVAEVDAMNRTAATLPRAPTTVTVDLGARSYDILIGRGVIDQAGAEIARRLPGARDGDRHRRDRRRASPAVR